MRLLGKILFLVTFCLVTLSIITSAQDADTCPAIVQMVLANVEDLCGETGRNQACYGNITLEAEARPDVESLQFDVPGDIANVADIQSLQISPLDEASGEWGVSLMRLQANLPDTLPGQNVTMLVFGDVEIENAAGGASEDETPMQVFYFRSGVGDAPCSEAPDSGILIQTPKGAGEIALQVNEVDISLGSTAYLQAEAGKVMTVSVIEGQATVTAFDVTQTIPAGEFATMPIDDNLAASGPPVEPEPYTGQIVEMLSGVVEVLPEAVVPSEPKSTAEIETVTDESEGCTVTAARNVNLRSGPGTVYPRAGGIEAGSSAELSGQAVGADGYTWWQLADGSWVRSDVVETEGNCEILPVVIDTPPTPTLAPVTTSGGGGGTGGGTGSATYIEVTVCNNSGGVFQDTAKANTSLVVACSWGFFDSEGRAQAAIDMSSFAMSVDNVNIPLSPRIQVSDRGYYMIYLGRVTLSPGTHTFYCPMTGTFETGTIGIHTIDRTDVCLVTAE